MTKKIVSLILVLITVFAVFTILPISTSAAETLTLKYDDYFNVTSKYSGYSVYSITSNKTTSYVVSKGVKSGTKDKKVLTTVDGGSTVVRAVGVGTCVLKLKKGSSTKTVSVTVKPAKLTIVFVAGQSNAIGYTNHQIYKPNIADSVKCARGTAYSAVGLSRRWQGRTIGGEYALADINASNASMFIPASLNNTETKAINGNKMNYPTYALTSSGRGKAGLDGAFAYRWNKLTGDKVFLANAAIESSSINHWVNGARKSSGAKKFYYYAQKVYNSEILAGHFTRGTKLCLWLQGESDRNMSAASYASKFNSVQNSFLKFFTWDYFGIILNRATQNDTESVFDQFYMNGPRTAQNYVGNSKDYKKTFIISNLNETWNSNANVTAYFKKAYPSGKVTYPLRSNNTLKSLPKTTQQCVYKYHYSQYCHNENGFDAANNLYRLVNNSASTATVKWMYKFGSFMGTDTYNTGVGTRFYLSARYYPSYMGKKCDVVVDGEYLTQDPKTQSFIAKKEGTTYIKVLNPNGNTISIRKIVIRQYHNPIITSFVNKSNGVQITWDKQAYARKYRLYIKSGSSWKTLTTTSSNTYFHKTALGASYTYTVRCLDESLSPLSSYKASGYTHARYIATPYTAVAVQNSTIKVAWKKVSGAYAYKVYCNVGSKWNVLTTTKNNTYVLKKLKDNTKYTFAVRCVDKKGKLISDYQRNVFVKYFLAPTLVSASNTEEGIRIEWKAKSLADNYIVFRKTANSGWKFLGNTGGNINEYIDSDFEDGITYYYTVRCCNIEGSKATSLFDKNGLKIVAEYVIPEETTPTETIEEPTILE